MKTCALVVACALLVACGKKGPPLLPFVRQPNAAEITAARRVGNDVYLTISVPTANVDDSMPASIAKIDVWAVTAATAPTQNQFTSVGTLVTSVRVARYPDPSDRSGTIVPDPKTGALQGVAVTIRESLTPEAMIRREPSVPKSTGPAAAPVPPSSATAAPEVLRRFYMTIPASEKGRAGPPSMIAEVPMTMMPGKVPALRVAMRGHDVMLDWEPAGGLVGWLVDRALALEPAPFDERQTTPAGGAPPPARAPSGPTLYFIYEDISPDPLALPSTRAAEAPWAASPPTAINAQPQPGLTFTQDVPFDGRERCYQVSGVRGTGAQRIEGEPSDRHCIVSIDTEAPAAPTGLMATVLDGSIELRWEPNGEEDLLGYVVLRRTAGSDTLQLRTPVPLSMTRFADADVVAGQTYTYVVRAVDNRVPLPNVSDDSAETTATAR